MAKTQFLWSSYLASYSEHINKYIWAKSYTYILYRLKLRAFSKSEKFDFVKSKFHKSNLTNTWLSIHIVKCLIYNGAHINVAWPKMNEKTMFFFFKNILTVNMLTLWLGIFSVFCHFSVSFDSVNKISNFLESRCPELYAKI